VSHSPLVILGFDVGDAQWLLDWAREGRLPTLASLLDRGVWGRTTGPDLINEHSVWVSLLTGVPLWQHGFSYHRRLKPGTYTLEEITGKDIDAKPFWAHAPAKRIAVIDAPHFYPEPAVNGIQLSEWATHHPSFAPAALPQGLLDAVRRVAGPQIRVPEVLDSDLPGDRRLYDLTLQRVERKGVLCRHLLKDGDFDVVVIVFADTHLASHQFWPYRPDHQGARKIDPQDVLSRAIPEVYARIDRQMGAILAELPRDANVCIVSSTGMRDHFPTTGLIESFCRTLGYQAAPPPSNQRRPLGLARTLVPERVRSAISSWLPHSTRERLVSDKFQHGTDWSRTTAFAIPTFYTSFVHVNLKGREPQGTVFSGPEYEALLDRLEADLLLLTDCESGQPLVREMVRTASLTGGGPPELLPDLFVSWASHTRYLERARHPRGEIVAYPPDIWRGYDHTSSGFVALAGPTVQRREPLGEVSLLDLAPTFLALIGEAPGKGMTGRPLPVLVDGAGR
jgi:predicted AlkP superfamily phosphohydrolase/phosphomutase